MFHQLLKHIHCYYRNRVDKRYKSNGQVCTLNCLTLFIALIYAKLAQRFFTS
ncbi:MULTISPECIES: DUF4372 domain-containing protein [Nitrosomonas]|uniref:DUF4372 domain-containing protein n=1 Tax=Nitrosomonas TaxID=914 RepID=UPI0009E5FD01